MVLDHVWVEPCAVRCLSCAEQLNLLPGGYVRVDVDLLEGVNGDSVDSAAIVVANDLVYVGGGNGIGLSGRRRGKW